MSNSAKLFESKEKMSRVEVADLLRQLADRIAEGEVLLRQGREEVMVELPETLKFELQATRKEKPGKSPERELEIELKWVEGEELTNGGKLELG